MMDIIAYRFADDNPDMTIVGLKFFNVYGPREYYKAKTSSMVIQLGHQILDGKAPRLFEGSGQILRDFINIKDVIQANIKACSPKKNGTYNYMCLVRGGGWRTLGPSRSWSRGARGELQKIKSIPQHWIGGVRGLRRPLAYTWKSSG